MSAAEPTVAFVCEGPTDVEVFRVLVEHILGRPIRPLYLQPDLDALDPAGGDTRVERWCRANGPGLQWLLEWQAVDLLLVHLDADRCARFGVADTAGLCATIKGWLGAGAARPELLIALPAQATEAWLVAAHRPSTPALEATPRPENALAELGLLDRDRRGRSLKSAPRYAPMARTLAGRLDDVRPVLPELDRFVRKLLRHPTAAPTRPIDRRPPSR